MYTTTTARVLSGTRWGGGAVRQVAGGQATLLTLIKVHHPDLDREVIGERIRDKFAASRKKGMWMGG